MSTILKALRRLEQEKAAQAQPPLEAAVVRSGEQVAGVPARARWIVGVTAAAALGVGVGWLFQNRLDAAAPPEARVGAVSAPSAEAGAAAQPARPTEPPAAPSPVARAPESETPRVVVAAGETAAPADAPLPAPIPVAALPPVVAPEPVAPPPAAQPRAPVTAPGARVSRAEPRPTAPRAELPESSTLDTPAGAVVAAPVTRGEEEALDDVVRPVESAPPRGARTASSIAPGLAVLRTIWHPKPERRTALVETRDDFEPFEVREGELVGSLTVVRIEPSGVVFERNGEQLRQKVGGRP